MVRQGRKPMHSPVAFTACVLVEISLCALAEKPGDGTCTTAPVLCAGERTTLLLHKMCLLIILSVITMHDL